jgi:integrase/recombinase XerC
MNFPEFEAHLTAQDKSAHTIKGYLSDLRRFARWFEQTNGYALSPEGITAIDVRQYRQYLQTVKNYKAATINRRLSAIRTYTQWALDKGQINFNPVENVQGITQQEEAPRWLDKREQRALLRQVSLNHNAAETPAALQQAVRDQLILVLLLNTGLRVSELCQVQLGDLEISERKGSLQVRQGKGGKAREIPLNKACRQALADWFAQRPEAASSHLLIGKRGGRLKARGVERVIEGLGRQSGVEVTPHVLRHTFAKSLVDAGVTLEKVAMLLGHSNLNTTRIYITPSQADLAEAVGLLGG